MAKFLDDAGLSRVWAKITALLNGKANSSHTHTIANVTSLQDELDNRYKKSETYSQAEINTKFDNINTFRVLNKSSIDGGVVNATLATVDDVCTQYVQDNYSRTPRTLDTIIVTLTDANNDKVKYTYSGTSAAWIDTGRESLEISNATDSTAGIAKLYGTADGTNEDGSVHQKGIKDAIDAVKALITSLENSVYKKTETYAKTEVYSKSETYGKTEVYTKGEVDTAVSNVENSIPVAMTSGEVDAIINA